MDSIETDYVPHWEILELLCTHEASANIDSEDGRPLLGHLLGKEQETMITFLVDNGAIKSATAVGYIDLEEDEIDDDIEFRYVPLLAQAVHEQRTAMVKLLLDKGADPFCGGTRDYEDVFVLAQRVNNPDILAMLQEARNKSAQKPL